MDVLEFVARVLCRLDLPDTAVYPALALARNARQSGDEQEILRTEKALTECFLDCVRRGLQLKKEEDPWQALDKHPLLAEKPARPQPSQEIPTVEQQQHWQSLILEMVEANSSPKMQINTELRQLIGEILWGDEPEQAPLPSLKSAQSMDEVDLIHRVLCRLDLPDAAVYSSLARLRDVRQTEDSEQIAFAFRELLRTFFEAVRLGLGAPEKQEPWIHLRQRAELQDDPDIQAMLDYLIPPYRSPDAAAPGVLVLP